MKGRIAQKLDIGGTLLPGTGEGAEKIFVGVADPQTRLGREPVELAQPLRRRFEPRIVEDLRLVGGAPAWFVRLPVVSVPEPDAVVAFAPGEQAKANRFIE